MDHLTAVRIGAAELYAMGELDALRREEFEEHYFDCRECAAEVKLEQAFAANMRSALLRFAQDPGIPARHRPRYG